MRHDIRHDLIAQVSLVIGLAGGNRSLLGMARNFLGGGQHLIHGGCHLLGFLSLITHPRTGLFGDGGKLLGSAGDLLRVIADIANQPAQVQRHLSHAVLQLAQLILATGLHFVAQIAFGNAIGH